MGANRTGNMWAFVGEGVKLLRDVLKGSVEADEPTELQGEVNAGKEEGKL